MNLSFLSLLSLPSCVLKTLGIYFNPLACGLHIAIADAFLSSVSVSSHLENLDSCHLSRKKCWSSAPSGALGSWLPTVTFPDVYPSL